VYYCLLFTYLLNILCIALVYDWFYIRQAYLVALIGLMEFYNKMMMILVIAIKQYSKYRFCAVYCYHTLEVKIVLLSVLYFTKSFIAENLMALC
jgi:hypothetical protein